MEELTFLIKDFEIKDYVNGWKHITLHQISDKDEDGIWVSEELEKTDYVYADMDDWEILDDIGRGAIIDYLGMEDEPDVYELMEDEHTDDILDTIDIKDIKEYIKRNEDA